MNVQRKLRKLVNYWIFRPLCVESSLSINTCLLWIWWTYLQSSIFPIVDLPLWLNSTYLLNFKLTGRNVLRSKGRRIVALSFLAWSRNLWRLNHSWHLRDWSWEQELLLLHQFPREVYGEVILAAWTSQIGHEFSASHLRATLRVCTRSMGGVNITISVFHHPGYAPYFYSSRVSSRQPMINHTNSKLCLSIRHQVSQNANSKVLNWQTVDSHGDDVERADKEDSTNVERLITSFLIDSVKIGEDVSHFVTFCIGGVCINRSHHYKFILQFWYFLVQWIILTMMYIYVDTS